MDASAGDAREIDRRASSPPPANSPHRHVATAPTDNFDQTVADGAVSGHEPADGLELLLQRVAEPAPVGVGAGHVPEPTDAPAIQIDRAHAVDRSAMHDDDSVDAGALAEKVYPHIERRLRADLLHEVERRGHLSRWG